MPLNKRIEGYSQKVRADVRVIRTLAGLGILHPVIIYKIGDSGIKGWEDIGIIGLNLLPYATAYSYVSKPRRLKQLIPNHIRRAVNKN